MGEQEKFEREEIEDFLIDLASTFASENEDGDWWGHDTNLGDCMEAFSKAQTAHAQSLARFRERVRAAVDEKCSDDMNSREYNNGIDDAIKAIDSVPL